MSGSKPEAGELEGMNPQEHSDVLFAMRLEQWSFLHRRYSGFFSRHEIDTLQRSERTFRSGARTVVFCAFENRFASLGGLGPVVKALPKHLMAVGERVIFMSPFHAGHPSMKSALRAGLLKRYFGTAFHLCGYEATLTCYSDTSSEPPSYYIRISDRFTAGENPYGYGEGEDLLFDALSFAAAVPFVLGKLGLTDNILFHVHEWQTAPIALTSKMAVISAVLNQARTVLTLHNSFDCALPARLKHLFFGKEIGGETVLQCTIPFLNAPLLTVSMPFAHELRHDPLQRTVFADHLQTLFSMNPPLGIENGIFRETQVPFTPIAMALAEKGDFGKLLERKNTYRRRFLKALQRARDPRIVGKLEVDPEDSPVPVFYMAGRLDYMQKGFDVMVSAFERLERGCAKLVFCPSSMNGSKTDELKFFKDIAARCPGDIEIWPFKIPSRLYELFLKGANFLLMPSLYEPFGSANEGLVNGTPVVARGTGGLWIQVVSSRPVQMPAFYGSLHWSGNQEFPTGILFRETYSDAAAESEWRDLLRRPPEERLVSPLFAALLQSAHEALEYAITMYHHRPHDYARLILNGVKEVKKVSWERAALKYQRVYDVAVTRGV